jgi:hypothetical protein
MVLDETWYAVSGDHIWCHDAETSGPGIGPTGQTKV